MDEVNKLLEGKQDLQLSPEGETYYQYAQELSLFDVEILANLALRHYYQSSIRRPNGQGHSHYQAVLLLLRTVLDALPCVL